MPPALPTILPCEEVLTMTPLPCSLHLAQLVLHATPDTLKIDRDNAIEDSRCWRRRFSRPDNARRHY